MTPSRINIVLAALVITACTAEKFEKVRLPDLEVPEEWKDAQQIPVRGAADGVQPMTGIAFWTDNDKVATDCIQLEYSYMRYCDVCTQKDVYDWSAVEALLDEVAARKHQAIIRFYYTYVGQECTVPDYIKALPEYEETVGRSEGERTCFPDWRCGELRRFHLEFYRRFAERYDHDPRLAFLETGFGLWAEYHIYDGPYIPGRTFPSKEFQKEWLQKMSQWFTDLPWCISIDAADYGPFEETPGLLDLRFGNFDDSFMCKEHDKENAVNWRFFGTERYKSAPLGGEFSYYTSYDQRHCLDEKGLHGRLFEEQADRFHLTFIIGNDQPQYQKLSRIRSAGTATGYRFRIRQIRIKEGVGAAVLIENAGAAPIYRDAFLAVDGVRSDFNLRALMPDQQVWLEIPLPSVSETSTLSIVCDHLVPGQEIGFIE